MLIVQATGRRHVSGVFVLADTLQGRISEVEVMTHSVFAVELSGHGCKNVDLSLSAEAR